MRTILSLLALALAAAAADKPNIVIILCDDMGFSDLGCMGGEIATPNLDSLAAGGLRFTQFYNTARCCPTRASLLTGQHPHQAGVGHMTVDTGLPAYSGQLNKTCRTIPERLKPAGYRSYAVGKWHVAHSWKAENWGQSAWPLARGFDRYYGTIHGAGSYWDPATLMRDNTMISAFADPQYKPKTYYYTDAIADHAVKFVGDHSTDHKDKPFFLYVAFTAAHWPMHALPEDIAKYKGKYDAGYEPIRQARFEKAAKLGLIDPKQPMADNPMKWDDVKDKKWEAAGMEVYAAMIDRMDQGVGKLIAELKRTKQFDNTLIMFLQDNGGCAEVTGRTGNVNNPNIDRPAAATLPPLKAEDFQFPGSIPRQTRDGFPVRSGPKVWPGPDDTYVAYGRGWATVSNTPFREYKHWVHEGGISTPLVAHWPKGISSKGELRKQPGQLTDLCATCCDLAAAAPIEPALEGLSLRPAFENKPLADHFLFWEHEGNRAIRLHDMKLVAKHGKAWELYDLSKDRIERTDLAGQPDYAKILELGSQCWKEWSERCHVADWNDVQKRLKK